MLSFAFALLLAQPSAPTAKCVSRVRLEERVIDGKRSLLLFNRSKIGIVGYVVTLPNNPANIFSGKFGDPSQLAPNSFVKLGVLADDQSPSSAGIDYLRFRDGSTCGPMATKDAKDLFSAQSAR